MNSTPRLVISSGEPAGIGPELILQQAQQACSGERIVIADRVLLEERAEKLKLPIKLIPYQPEKTTQASAAGELSLIHRPLKTPCKAGQLNPDNAEYVLDMLSLACDGCLNGEFNAMITAPVHKGIINEAGITFSGHTEFLAQRCQSPQVVMMLATQEMRVALATTHLPLQQVPDALTAELLEAVLEILHKDLQNKFGLGNPHILIAGLNPHAGEGGHIGREEIDIINPVIVKLRQQGMSLSDALPADTLFTPKHLDKADAVLAMYHDQGLPVLKYQGFGRAVNITLGLPIIRTSVDHGTALDLAGSGQANIGSLNTAIHYALLMAEQHSG